MAITLNTLSGPPDFLTRDSPLGERVYARRQDIADPLGRRSTIVGVPPSAVANFAKSLIVGARRGFSDAARRSIESAWPRVESGPAGPHRPTTRRGSAIGPAGPGRRRRRGPIAGHRRRGDVGPSHRGRGRPAARRHRRGRGSAIGARSRPVGQHMLADMRNRRILDRPPAVSGTRSLAPTSVAPPPRGADSSPPRW